VVKIDTFSKMSVWTPQRAEFYAKFRPVEKIADNSHFIRINESLRTFFSPSLFCDTFFPVKKKMLNGPEISMNSLLQLKSMRTDTATRILIRKFYLIPILLTFSQTNIGPKKPLIISNFTGTVACMRLFFAHSNQYSLVITDLKLLWSG